MSAATLTAVFVAAGSNVDPERNLRAALRLLAARFGRLEVSRAYRNAAVGFEGPDFINLVVGFDTGDSVREVVAALREIEGRCGRIRHAPKWASRSMDLDILLYGDVVCEGPDVTLPRPDLLRRAYMLGPLAEIAADVRHPVLRRPIGELWRSFDQHTHAMDVVDLN